MKRTFYFLFVLLITFCADVSAQTVYINELMASNTATLRDSSGAFEDWLEIYNGGTTPLNLNGFYLTDDPANLRKHRLLATGSELVIPAKGFLILWASSNVSKGSRHLGFSLGAGGESVTLSAPDGVMVIDSFRFGPQRQDISMARSSDGGSEWLYYDQPTPNKPNGSAKGYKGFVSAPQFSISGGFYTGALQLQLASSEPGAEILYTLDGSEPVLPDTGGTRYFYKNSYPGISGQPFGPLLQDSFRTMKYNGPIAIADRTPDRPVFAVKSSTVDQNPFTPPANIFKGTCVRARVIREGYLPGEIITHTYFITPQGRNRYPLPVSSLVIPPASLYDYSRGIYNAGKDFDDWRQLNPGQSPFYRAAANFRREGDSSERQANWEYFNGLTADVNQRVGVRIHGSSTTFNLVKSLRLYARAELGKPDFTFPFFKGYNLSAFRRLLLRPDDWERTAIRDLVVQHIGAGLNFDYQQGQPAVLFMNGEFWGIHNVRERIDRYYIEGKHGIPEGELDLLEDNALVSEGSNKAYLELRNFINTANLADPQNYASVLSAMDMNSFCDYFIHQTFIANRDWPYNNIRFYRKNTPPTPGATGPLDGRWRWILFDTDASYTTVNLEDTTLKRVMALENILFNKLINAPLFKDLFITRYTDLLNTVYLPQVSFAKIDSVAKMVGPVIEEHRNRLLEPQDLDTWTKGIQSMLNFSTARPTVMRRQMKELFGLADTHRITLNVSDTGSGFIQLNTLALKAGTPGVSSKPYPWQGLYFANRPVTLVPRPLPGFRFVRWEGDVATITDTLVITPDKPLQLTAVFEPMPAETPGEIIHYWHFNNLASGTLNAVNADSSVTGNAVITYPGTGAGYMDRVAGEGSPVNLQQPYPAGSALRVRNPSATRQLQFRIPSAGFQALEVSWAATRTSAGAQEQRVFYSTDSGNVHWQELLPNPVVTENYQLFRFNLKAISAANNNPHLALRVLFSGSNAGGSSGNNRFDNFTVKGIPGLLNCVGQQAEQLWFEDADGDGFSSGSRLLQCNAPAGYKLQGDLQSLVPDCNDRNASEFPGAVWYKDQDGDGYSDGVSMTNCSRPAGYAGSWQLKDTTGDCSDNNAAMYPGTVWYKDADGDGYGDGVSIIQCMQPQGYRLPALLTDTTGDCNDSEPGINPATTWYKDADNDGYSDGAIKRQCLQPAGYKSPRELKATDTDCNDSDERINPTTVWYNDADGDGHSGGLTKTQCLQPAGYIPAFLLAETNTDCNDNDPAVFKGATEIPDGKDNDCDGMADLGNDLIVVVAPNPVNTELRLLLRVFIAGLPVNLSLLGPDGRVYMQQSIVPASFGQSLVWSAKTFTPGIYYVIAQQGAKKMVSKVLVVR